LDFGVSLAPSRDILQRFTPVCEDGTFGIAVVELLAAGVLQISFSSSDMSCQIPSAASSQTLQAYLINAGDDYNYDSTSIRLPIDCLSKVTVT